MTHATKMNGHRRRGIVIAKFAGISVPGGAACVTVLTSEVSAGESGMSIALS
jgi:hypothetical protein